MKRIISLLSLFVAVIVSANDGVDIPLWPDGAPNAFTYSYTQEYLEKNNIPVEPYFTLYEAPNPNGKIILACPGGGYGHLAKYHEGNKFAPWLNEQGITLAVLNYRMPCQHSDVPLSDVQRAMRMLREKYPDASIGVMGFSAGGHLASTAATHFVDAATRPDFQILFYPVISFDLAITHKGTHNNLIGETPRGGDEQYFSNELQVSPQMPPAIIFHSADDTVVPVANAYRYAQALADSHAPSELHVFPTGNHGWGFNPDFPYFDLWTTLLTAWLNRL